MGKINAVLSNKMDKNEEEKGRRRREERGKQICRL
jgi:hypothetical protein